MTDLSVPERYQPLFEDLFRVCTRDSAPSGLSPDEERLEMAREFAESVETMRLECSDLGLSEAAVDAMIEKGYREVLAYVTGPGSIANH